jgi:protoheme IX farnesyltransferase
MSTAAAAIEQGFVTTSRDYLELTKARIVMLVLITTGSGYLAAGLPIDAITLLHTLIGTALVAGGTNALNQYLEREHDRHMKRTRTRPLPEGRIAPRSALVFAASSALVGTLYLGLLVNWLTAFLGAFTLVSYAFLYTPMKRTSTFCTIVGAVPGAIPPMMGWAAATGSLGVGAWIIFGILFLWQMPHFMAISWIYREDYGRAGFVMLAVQDPRGDATARQAVIWCMTLLTVSLLPFYAGMTGIVYFTLALISGLAFLAAALNFFRHRDNRRARRLFMTSNLYLVTIMTLLVISVRAM